MMATSSTLHSQAFAFLSYLETGVDSRTGQYTCSLSLPELNNNDLAGPDLPLRLGYNPLNTQDSGYGMGWNLQLSQFDTERNVIALAGGETFKVTGTSSDSNQLLMREKKIDSFHLHKIDEKHYRVVHKSGLVEDLRVLGGDSLALPTRVYSASGHHIDLDYSIWNGRSMLESITDGDGHVLLWVERGGTSVKLRLHPGTDDESLYTLHLFGGEARVERIELPTDNLASWRFQYQQFEGLQCIVRVEGPLGGHEEIRYDGGVHRLPPPNNGRLPRVHRHLRDPGAKQPVIETRYDYSDENFLGFNAPGLQWVDNGEDNLYQLIADYRYDTTEHLWDSVTGKPLRSIKRVFNRFHLVVEETTRQGECVRSTLTDYNIKDGFKFEDQPAQCQLPSTVTHTWYRESESGRYREESETTEYDEHANEVLRIEASGITTVSEYYPIDGGDGCPPDPHGFMRHLKSQTVSPAEADYGNAPTLRTEYRYAAQAPITGGLQEWLAPVEETLFDSNGDVELQKQITHYIDKPDDPFLHGRTLKTEVVLDGKRVFTDYTYSKAQARRANETVLQVTEVVTTSFDEATRTVTREMSLINGEPLLELDENDTEIAYRYDALNRVIEEIAAPGSAYEAHRRYDYVLVNAPTGQASQTVTDVKGVQVCTLIDALQHVVGEQRSEMGKAALRDTYSATYNRFGQLQDSSRIDWLKDEERILPTHYTYDDWGEQDSVTGPEGVTRHTLNDPVANETQTWQDGEGRTVTRNNLFDKPDSVERLDLGGKPYSKREYFYDGLGRTDHDFDAMGEFRYYQYDVFDRMTLCGVPGTDGFNEVGRRYASHSRKELPVWIGVDGVPLGEQKFDGLGRRVESSVGPRLETYLYEGGRLQPRQRTTPAKDTIDYEYTLALTTSPVGQIAQDDTASYTYDHFDAQLLAAENDQGRREFEYDGARHLQCERWIENGKTWEATYEHSLDGRQLLLRDVNGLETHSHYDDRGRVELVTQDRIEVEHCYDALSRPWRSVCRDLDAQTELVTLLTFDDWSREVSRQLDLTGQPTRIITQTWRPDDRLLTRRQESDGELVLAETFGYDPRGRLNLHTCEGPGQPRDRYGNAIAEQAFEYDGMDNLYLVETRFADGSEDVCNRTFASDDPCQLVNLTHSHADYPASIDLEYDENGNLRFDELGRELLYDSQSRLLQVKDADGLVLASYHYDAHNQLSGETHGTTAKTLRFYHGERLGCSVQGSTRISFLHDEDRPLAVQRLGAADNSLLLTGANRSVLGESRGSALSEAGYSAYGERDDSLDCPLGFNGEVRDSDTGWYLLGNGYRAYNPYLMCFHSPDSLSPFGRGGLNAYMYGGGDPVNFRDPTGHFINFNWLPGWAGTVLPYVGLGLSLLSVVGSIGAFAAAGGLVSGFMKAGILSQATAVFTGASVLSGAASLMVSDKSLKRVFGLASSITGAIALSTSIASLGKFGMRGHAGKVKDAAKKSATEAGEAGANAGASGAGKTAKAASEGVETSTGGSTNSMAQPGVDDVVSPNATMTEELTEQLIPRVQVPSSPNMKVHSLGNGPTPPPKPSSGNPVVRTATLRGGPLDGLIKKF